VSLLKGLRLFSPEYESEIPKSLARTVKISERTFCGESAKKVINKGLWRRIKLPYTNTGRAGSVVHLSSQHLPNINAVERKGGLNIIGNLYFREGRRHHG
jgi:hypothetical protein